MYQYTFIMQKIGTAFSKAKTKFGIFFVTQLCRFSYAKVPQKYGGRVRIYVVDLGSRSKVNYSRSQVGLYFWSYEVP